MKKQKRKWSLKKLKKNEISPWTYLSSRSERKGVKKTLTSMFPWQLRVAWIMMVVEEIVVGALDLLLHLLLVLVELDALERPHPVLVIPRELLHDLLLLFYLVVRQSGQIFLLDHHDHVEQVVSHFNYFLFVLSKQFVHLLLVLSELLLAPVSQPLDILVPN